MCDDSSSGRSTVWFLWIEGERGVEDKHQGFCANCVVLAHSELEAHRIAKEALASKDMRLVSVEDSGDFDEFHWKDEVERLRLAKLAENMRKIGDSAFTAFHTWPKSSEEP